MHFKETTIDNLVDEYDDIVTEIETNLGCLNSFTDEAKFETPKRSKTNLTAETLRVFSSINVETLGTSPLLILIKLKFSAKNFGLGFDSRFDLLFNDISMLKATAVQGLLGNTNFRFLAWKIFLECIPMDRNLWIASVKQNRLDYEKVKEEFSCDPRKAKKNSNSSDNIDHPLSQDETVHLVI